MLNDSYKRRLCMSYKHGDCDGSVPQENEALSQVWLFSHPQRDLAFLQWCLGGEIPAINPLLKNMVEKHK
jgi:hypothetical protein